jgi:putative hemolysin
LHLIAFTTAFNESPDNRETLITFSKQPDYMKSGKTERRKKMKRLITFITILMALTACTARQAQAGMPNPASVYCEQKGNKLEIRSAADGSQSGVCVFPDGSTCDEWAYYRGECGGSTAQKSPMPAMTVEATTEPSGGGPGGSGGTEEQASGGYMPPGTTEEIADWWGVIKSTEAGAQYDDYVERQDLGQIIYFGIDAIDPAIQAQIKALRNSGKIAHLYGTLFSNVPDFNGSQIQVKRIEVEEQDAGSFMPPGATEEIVDWWGVIKSTEPGAQYDDYFERQDFVQKIYFGIDSMDPMIQVQIKALCDSGKIVHLYGTLVSNVPDYNGSQIRVDRIEVE